MADAKNALELLSREPSAQRLAEMRREAEIMRKLDRAEASEQALRRGIEALCRVLGIELDDARRAELEGLGATGLTARLEDIEQSRSWRTI